MKQTTFILILIILMVFRLNGQTRLEWSDWAKENAHSIRLSDTTKYDDLKFLEEVLKDKRIVFLGENSHGISEFTLLKSRIIQYLHKELGFNVLAFEANASDAYAANFSIKSGDALSNIHNSISVYWHVEEMIPLFQYITNTHNTDNPLNIAGIGIPLDNGNLEFSKYLLELIQPIDSVYARELYKNDSIFSIYGVQSWWMGNLFSEEERIEILEFDQEHLNRYNILIEFLENNKGRINDYSDFKAIKHYIQNRIDYIHWRAKDTIYMAEQIHVEGRNWSFDRLFSHYRDSRMSDNLLFLSEYLYPDEKIIVWAHNAHIEKYGDDMPNHPLILESSYTIPIFCYEGEGSWGRSFDPADPNYPYRFNISEDSASIETILNSTGYEVTFVDMENETKSAGNSWMFEHSRYHLWDGSNISDVNSIRNIYDGLFLIKKAKPPTFITFDFDYFRKVIESNKQKHQAHHTVIPACKPSLKAPAVKDRQAVEIDINQVVLNKMIPSDKW